MRRHSLVHWVCQAQGRGSCLQLWAVARRGHQLGTRARVQRALGQETVRGFQQCQGNLLAGLAPIPDSTSCAAAKQVMVREHEGYWDLLAEQQPVRWQ